MTTHPDLTAAREWNACVEVRVIATTAPRPADMQSGEDDDYCTASTRRDGVWNDRGVQDPPLCCWRPPDHEGDHHDPYEHLDWRWEARYDWMGRAEAALAARSAGSGSRVEAKWPVVGVGDKGHRYTTCGHCVEPDCSTHTGHIERCYTRPTPPPAVDGTRWDKTKRCEAVVDGLPCHMPPEIHPKVVRNRPEYDHQFLPCHPATPPTPAPVDGTRCGECPHAAHTGDICDTDRPGFVTGCPCRTATPPTPAPAVDGTRCAECGGVKDDVFHVPCLVGGPFHYVKTCHPFTPPTPAPAVDGLAAFAAGFRARHEWPTPAPADRLRALEAALAMTDDERLVRRSLAVGDRNLFEARTMTILETLDAARALLGPDGEGSRS